MGYSTDFSGKFTVNKPVDEETAKLLKGLATTRRMKRNLSGYGVEGEFFVGDTEDFGQRATPDVIDSNSPPSTQPSLWCQWLLQKDNQTIKWDEGEKFYGYIDWIKYLIDKILKPRGYFVSGEVEWFGDDREDLGKIIIKNNDVTVKTGRIAFD